MKKKESLLNSIFWSFDIYKKEELMSKWIEKYWEWNFMLLKRHWYFLIWPIFSMMLWIIMFCWLIYLSYLQHKENYLYLSIMIWWYSIFTLQWLIITIKFILHSIQNSKIMYFNLDVNFEKNNSRFERFVNQSILSIAWQIIMWIISILLLIISFWSETSTLISVILQTILNILFIVVIYSVFKKLVDFEMDFTTIDPLRFVSYSQQWLNNFSSKDLETEIIKSVTIEQEWLIRSLFSFWKILIKWIWDETWVKKYSISLNFIKNPETVKERIDQIRRKRHEFEASTNKISNQLSDA